MADTITKMLSEQGAVAGLLVLILLVVWKAYKTSLNRLFKFMESNQKIIIDNTIAMTSLTKAVEDLAEAQSKRRSEFKK